MFITTTCTAVEWIWLQKSVQLNYFTFIALKNTQRDEFVLCRSNRSFELPLLLYLLAWVCFSLLQFWVGPLLQLALLDENHKKQLKVNEKLFYWELEWISFNNSTESVQFSSYCETQTQSWRRIRYRLVCRVELYFDSVSLLKFLQWQKLLPFSYWNLSMLNWRKVASQQVVSLVWFSLAGKEVCFSVSLESRKAWKGWQRRILFGCSKSWSCFLPINITSARSTRTHNQQQQQQHSTINEIRAYQMRQLIALPFLHEGALWEVELELELEAR